MAEQVREIYVDAKSEGLTGTGLHFKQGAKVTIVAQGSASVDAGDRGFVGAAGYMGWHVSNALSPEHPVGALLVKCGETFTPVEGGLLDWSPPSPDQLQFGYNDRNGKYRDNGGGFNIQIKYDSDEVAL